MDIMETTGASAPVCVLEDMRYQKVNANANNTTESESTETARGRSWKATKTDMLEPRFTFDHQHNGNKNSVLENTMFCSSLSTYLHIRNYYTHGF